MRLQYVASIDGFGDRDDIALANDRMQGNIYENDRKFDSELHQTLLNSTSWSEDPKQKYIVDLILEMIRSGSSSMLGNKCNIYWGEIESISEAVNDACILEGLDEEDYSPSIRTDGFEYEIRLY